MMYFAYGELIDLLKSFIAVSLIFWWASGMGTSATAGGVPLFASLTIIAFFVGMAFILHELAHKAMATFYGYRATYHSFDKMIIVSLILGFFGIIFLAPGAVVVEQVRKLKHLGIISLVGPLTNVILALGCAAFIPLFPIAKLGFQINAWLALFNMLPLFGLDGSKVLAWNKAVYVVAAIVVGALYFSTYL